MKKCINCKKENVKIEFELYTWEGIGKKNVKFECCSEECKNEVEKFADYVNKNAVKFFVLIGIDILSFIPFTILHVITDNKIWIVLEMLVILVGCGLIVIKYPFATPETNKSFGLRKSIKLTKGIGIGCIIFGVILSVLIYLIDL